MKSLVYKLIFVNCLIWLVVGLLSAYILNNQKIFGELPSANYSIEVDLAHCSNTRNSTGFTVVEGKSTVAKLPHFIGLPYNPRCDADMISMITDERIHVRKRGEYIISVRTDDYWIVEPAVGEEIFKSKNGFRGLLFFGLIGAVVSSMYLCGKAKPGILHERKN